MEVLAEVCGTLPQDLQLLLWSHLVGGETWNEAVVEVGTTLAGAKRRFQRAGPLAL